MTEGLHLSRAQLAVFLKDPQAIKQFEELFKLTSQSIPNSFVELTTAIEATQVSADSARYIAIQALGELNRIANALEMLALAPVQANNVASVDIVPPMQIGTLGEQQADRVAITGGAVVAAITNNQTILLASSATLSNGAATSLGTITNAPAVGNPTKWVAIDDNGTTRYIPTW